MVGSHEAASSGGMEVCGCRCASSILLLKAWVNQLGPGIDHKSDNAKSSRLFGSPSGTCCHCNSHPPIAFENNKELSRCQEESQESETTRKID